MANKKKLLIAATVSITGIVVHCRNQQIFFVGVCDPQNFHLPSIIAKTVKTFTGY